MRKILFILLLIPFFAKAQRVTGANTLLVRSESDVRYSLIAGSTSIVTVGTIATGTWQGGVIGSTYGGTGINNAGRTLTINTNSGTLAFPGAGTTMTFPSTSATIARTDAANTFTGIQTMTSPAITTPTGIVKGDVGLGSVENTALSTWAGSANIVTVGTIATGVWNGTAITVPNGGTGVGTLTGVVIGNGTGNLTAVAGAASQYLRRNAGNTAYEFATIAGGGDVSGPVVSVNGQMVLFDGITGKLIKADASTGIVKTTVGVTSVAVANDFPTLNQNTTGSAGSLKSVATTGLMTVTGMGAATTRAKTVRDADDTFLELGGSYTPTGTWTNMVMVTPTIGAATATTINGNTFTTGTYTLTGTAAKTLTFNNSITLAGTDGKGINVGAATTGKILRGDGTNMILTTATYPNDIAIGDVLVGTSNSVVGVVDAVVSSLKVLQSNAGAPPTWSIFTMNGTTNAAYTFPTSTATIARTDAAQTFTGVQTMTSPVFTTPSLGVATATSINGNTFTTGTYTLTGVAAKTLTFNNSITLAGTDATTMTFPATSATIAQTNGAGTLTAATAAIANTETKIMSSDATMAASRLVAGTVFEVTLHGTTTSTAAGAGVIRVRYGTNGTTADGIMQAFTLAAAPTSGTAIPFTIKLLVTVRTNGASATSDGGLTLVNSGTTGLSATATQVVRGTATTINTTTAATFFTITYISGNASTATTFQDAVITILNK